MLRKDGTEFGVLIGCRRITYEGAPALEYSFTDITAQKEIEGEKRRTEERRILLKSFWVLLDTANIIPFLLISTRP